MGPETLGEALRDPQGLAFPPIKSTIAKVGDIGIKMANEVVVGTDTVQKFTGLSLQELKGKVGQSIKLILDSTNTVVGVEVGEKPRDSYALGEAPYNPEALLPPQTTKIIRVVDGCMEMANGLLIDRHTIAKFTGLSPDEVKTKVGYNMDLAINSSNTIVSMRMYPDLPKGQKLKPGERLETTKMVGVVDGCMEMGDGKIVDRHTIAKYTGLTPDEVKNKLGSEVTLKFDRSNTIVGVTLAV